MNKGAGSVKHVHFRQHRVVMDIHEKFFRAQGLSFGATTCVVSFRVFFDPVLFTLEKTTVDRESETPKLPRMLAVDIACLSRENPRKAFVQITGCKNIATMQFHP